MTATGAGDGFQIGLYVCLVSDIVRGTITQQNRKLFRLSDCYLDIEMSINNLFSHILFCPMHPRLLYRVCRQSLSVTSLATHRIQDYSPDSFPVCPLIAVLPNMYVWPSD